MVRLRSRLAPRQATLGDPVIWTLSADLPASARPGKLLRGSTAPELDIRPPREARKEHSPDGDQRRALWSWPYQVRGFTLGQVALPLVRVPVAFGTARDTLYFPADTLAVDSLTRAATGTVLPDRGAIAPELRPIDYVVAGALVVVLLAILALILRAVRKRREAPVVAEPVETPEEALRRSLSELRAMGETLPRDGFYDRLSMAIRLYAGSVTGVSTRDRTTLEIVRELRALPDIPPDGLDAVRRALSRADLAKFARRGGAWDEALQVLELADRLPEQLPARPHPVEASPAAGLGGG